MDPKHSLDVQAGIRQNVEEMNSVLRDFSAWTCDMKESNVFMRRDSVLEDDAKQEKIKSKNSIEKGPSGGINSVSNDESNIPVKKSMNELVDDERRRGNDLYSSGQYSEAIKAYSRCLTLNPKCDLAYTNRGEDMASIFIHLTILLPTKRSH